MKMKKRRKSRELALQSLFYMDARQNISIEALKLFSACFLPLETAFEENFFADLNKGVMQNISQIDGIIERFSDNWKMNRMSCVDRNVMRISLYEMLFCKDIPFKVSINEAIDIGKKFGTPESGAFINGILDSIHNALKQKKIKPQYQITAEIPLYGEVESDLDITPDMIKAKLKIPFSPVRGRPGVVKRRALSKPAVSDTAE